MMTTQKGIGKTGLMPDVVGPDPQYDVFADEFLAHARGGFYNAHYDRPACLDLLGDVAERTVLDVACGPGLYSEHLVARGPKVTGFLIERLIEPRPVAEAADIDRDAYERLSREPSGFLAIRALRDPRR